MRITRRLVAKSVWTLCDTNALQPKQDFSIQPTTLKGRLSSHIFSLYVSLLWSSIFCLQWDPATRTTRLFMRPTMLKRATSPSTGLALPMTPLWWWAAYHLLKEKAMKTQLSKRRKNIHVPPPKITLCHRKALILLNIRNRAETQGYVAHFIDLWIFSFYVDGSNCSAVARTPAVRSATSSWASGIETLPWMLRGSEGSAPRTRDHKRPKKLHQRCRETLWFCQGALGFCQGAIGQGSENIFPTHDISSLLRQPSCYKYLYSHQPCLLWGVYMKLFYEADKMPVLEFLLTSGKVIW